MKKEKEKGCLTEERDVTCTDLNCIKSVHIEK